MRLFGKKKKGDAEDAAAATADAEGSTSYRGGGVGGGDDEEEDATNYSSAGNLTKKRPQTFNMTVVDATNKSILLSWPETNGDEKVSYLIQFRKGPDDDDDDDDDKKKNKNKKKQPKDDIDEDLLYMTLERTSVPEMKVTRAYDTKDKKERGFIFRAGALVDGARNVTEWSTHHEIIHYLTKEEENLRMQAPKVALGGLFESLYVKWRKAKTKKGNVWKKGYEVQIRETTYGSVWKSLPHISMRNYMLQPNLVPDCTYQFRVRPAGTGIPFSPPNEPSPYPIGLTKELKETCAKFKHALIRRNGEKVESLIDAFGGKQFILFFVSAHWCTSGIPYCVKLKTWYDSLVTMDKDDEDDDKDESTTHFDGDDEDAGGELNRLVEVVYVAEGQEKMNSLNASLERENTRFKEYLWEMPWLAIDYMDEPTRENTMKWLGIKSIPQLVVMDAKTGLILDTNGINHPLDIERWRKMAAAAAAPSKGGKKSKA